MKISAVVAMSENRAIGLDNQMPWHLPDDLRWFKRQTLGKPVIMGRKTYDSIGKPLPKRRNIILTRDRKLTVSKAIITHSKRDALLAGGDASELCVIGGEEIYRLFLPKLNRLYLTVVNATVEGDAFFPEFELAEWEETYSEEHPADDAHQFSFRWVILDKKIIGK